MTNHLRNRQVCGEEGRGSNDGLQRKSCDSLLDVTANAGAYPPIPKRHVANVAGGSHYTSKGNEMGGTCDTKARDPHRASPVDQRHPGYYACIPSRSRVGAAVLAWLLELETL